MKPALGHVTCGLGGADGLRLAVVGAGWLAGCVCCAVLVGWWWLEVRAGDVGCVALRVDAIWLVVCWLVCLLNWLVDVGGGVVIGRVLAAGDIGCGGYVER